MKVALTALCLLLLVITAFCDTPPREPFATTICKIKEDPAAYNHIVVKVTGFVSHEFEDFSIWDPMCPSYPNLWLEYGGKVSSGTVYCCGGTSDRSRPKQLTVEKIPIPLLENQRFRDFDKAIQPPFRSGQHGAVVHATLIGRFFAGKKGNIRGKDWYGGYGHMGCCTLLAIEEVDSVDTEDRPELDYGSSPDQPELSKAGCGFKLLLPIDLVPDLLKWQQRADFGNSTWVFDDPQRVASETLTGLAHANLEKVSLTLVREAQGRRVYAWHLSDKEQYTIVISRPYWLSFYSRTPRGAAWVPIGAYRSSCEGSNPATRIK